MTIIGQVYRLDKKSREGTIIGRDGRQYSFSMKDYRGTAELKEGHLVQFTADGKSAIEIVLAIGPLR